MKTIIFIQNITSYWKWNSNTIILVKVTHMKLRLSAWNWNQLIVWKKISISFFLLIGMAKSRIIFWFPLQYRSSIFEALYCRRIFIDDCCWEKDFNSSYKKVSIHLLPVYSCCITWDKIHRWASKEFVHTIKVTTGCWLILNMLVDDLVL